MTRQRGWRLSPAFDLNPMPGDRRESKTWLTEHTGGIDSRDMLMAAASCFRLDAAQSLAIWSEAAQRRRNPGTVAATGERRRARRIPNLLATESRGFPPWSATGSEP